VCWLGRVALDGLDVLELGQENGGRRSFNSQLIQTLQQVPFFKNIRDLIDLKIYFYKIDLINSCC